MDEEFNDLFVKQPGLTEPYVVLDIERGGNTPGCILHDWYAVSANCSTHSSERTTPLIRLEESIRKSSIVINLGLDLFRLVRRGSHIAMCRFQSID